MALNLNAIMKDLPEDPREAIKVLADRIRDPFGTNKLGAMEISEACALLRRFSDTTGVDLKFPQKAGHSWSEHLSSMLGVIQTYSIDNRGEIIGGKLDALIQEYQASTERDSSFGFAFLTAGEKEAIHHNITAIRKAIESSSLAPRKKRALFGRLNMLAEEVDKDGTKTDAFFAFLGDLALVSGEMAEKAKPAINQFKEVLEIVAKSRAKQEGASLPSPEDLKLLPDRSEER
jgi:hypothetical protein